MNNFHKSSHFSASQWSKWFSTISSWSFWLARTSIRLFPTQLCVTKNRQSSIWTRTSGFWVDVWNWASKFGFFFSHSAVCRFVFWLIITKLIEFLSSSRRITTICGTRSANPSISIGQLDVWELLVSSSATKSRRNQLINSINWKEQSLSPKIPCLQPSQSVRTRTIMDCMRLFPIVALRKSRNRTSDVSNWWNFKFPFRILSNVNKITIK